MDAHGFLLGISFSPLLIGIAVVTILAVNPRVDQHRTLIFQSPFNRDSSCNSDRPRYDRQSYGSFSPLLIGIAIVTAKVAGNLLADGETFSPLLIGIAVVTRSLMRLAEVDVSDFQSPFNRDSSCNFSLLRQPYELSRWAFSPLLIGIAVVTNRLRYIWDNEVLGTFSPLLIGIAVVTQRQWSDQYDRLLCTGRTFSPLLIGIAVVTDVTPNSTASIRVGNFQSPFNRDSSCNHRAFRMLEVGSFSVLTFSPLLIGIAVVT